MGRRAAKGRLRDDGPSSPNAKEERASGSGALALNATASASDAHSWARGGSGHRIAAAYCLRGPERGFYGPRSAERKPRPRRACRRVSSTGQAEPQLRPPKPLDVRPVLFTTY